MKFLLATYDETGVPIDETGKPLDVFNEINRAFLNIGVETVMQEFSRPQSAVGAIAEEVALAGGSPAERLFLALETLINAIGASHEGQEEDLSIIQSEVYSLLDELRSTVLP